MAWLLIGLCSMVNLQAAEELPIYRAQGSAKSQTDSERNAAASLYFGEIIVRASGRRDALMNPVIQAAIPKASSYLFSFSYTGNKTEIIECKPQTRVGIQLDYSPQAVNQLLKQAQLPLWPSQRPKVLVWTAYRVQDSVELQRVPDEVAMAQLQSQTYFRGLKIQMPELDLEDNIALSVHDIWQVNLEKIKTASMRYKPDVIVVARYQPVSKGALPPARIFDETNEDDSIGALEAIKPEIKPALDATEPTTEVATVPQGPWVAEWQIIDATGQQQWRDQTTETDELFTNFANKVADHLSSQYAITLGQQTAQTYYMQISHVRDFAAMKKSQAYLKTLALVQKSELIRVNEQGLLLALTIEGDARLLASTLLLGKRLLPEFTANTPNRYSTGEAIDATLTDVTAIDAAQTLSAPADIPVVTEMSGPSGTLDDPLRYVWQEQ